MSNQPPLPQRTRALTIIAMVFAGLVGVSSAIEAMGLTDLSQLPKQAGTAYGPYDPKTWQKAYELQLALLNGVKEPRMILLALLAFASALIFVAAARMLRPGGMPRESMRKLIVGAGFATALLRVVYGAQSAVIFQKVSGVFAQAVPQLKLPAGTSVQQFQQLIPKAAVGAVGIWTLVVAGLFVLVSQHYRSPKIRELLERSDETLDQG